MLAGSHIYSEGVEDVVQTTSNGRITCLQNVELI